MTTYDVAVVGGGFSGTLVALNATRLAPRPLRIALLDRRGAFGAGLAYAASHGEALLNVPAGAMGAFPDDPGEFVRWLRDEAGIDADALPSAPYAPRRLYGAYVGALLAAAHRAGHTIDAIVADVADLRRETDGLACLDRHGKSLATGRHVVLALGTPPPPDPLPRMDGLLRDSRYRANPWLPLVGLKVEPGQSILVLGTGLTALDVIYELVAGGSTAHIYALSRRGGFPLAHAAQPSAPLPFAVRPLPTTMRALLRAVRAAVAANGGDWRAVIDGLRLDAAELWAGLAAAERRRFMRHVRPFWNRHRHRAPQRVLAAKDALVAAGQVEIVTGRLVELRDAGDALEAVVAANGTRRTLRVARVVNCTGPGARYAPHDQPLVDALVRRGELCYDPDSFGLRADADARTIDAHGRAHADLWTIGWPMRGVRFETTAVREIRAHARDLAAALVRAEPG
ncbi:MAG: hypothetical protein QOI11_537 [Candidatus Eremiobacteraeota bacterium]|nr:hypothetical protein [Candidatus Eremiobacteraeota bacterium]